MLLCGWAPSCDSVDHVASGSGHFPHARVLTDRLHWFGCFFSLVSSVSLLALASMVSFGFTGFTVFVHAFLFAVVSHQTVIRLPALVVVRSW